MFYGLLNIKKKNQSLIIFTAKNGGEHGKKITLYIIIMNIDTYAQAQMKVNYIFL